MFNADYLSTTIRISVPRHLFLPGFMSWLILLQNSTRFFCTLCPEFILKQKYLCGQSDCESLNRVCSVNDRILSFFFGGEGGGADRMYYRDLLWRIIVESYSQKLEYFFQHVYRDMEICVHPNTNP